MVIWCGLRLRENSYEESGHSNYKENEVEISRDDKVGDYNTNDDTDLEHYHKLVSLVLSCPFMQEQTTDLYAYKIPVFVLLVANSFFLVWIMVVSGNFSS